MLAVSRLSIQIGYLFSIAFVRTPIVGGTFFSGSITIGSSYQTNGSSITSKICWSFTGVSIPSIHQCYSVISGGVIGYCIDSLHQCGLLPYGISLLTPSTGCVSCYRRCCWTTSRTNSTLILLFVGIVSASSGILRRTPHGCTVYTYNSQQRSTP